MNSKLKLAAIVSAMLFLPAAHAATMTPVDYSAGKTRISDVYKTDKGACSSQTGNAKDVCIEEAKAKEKVARAELEYNRSGKAADQTKLAQVRARTTYAVAKERCDDQAGNPKDVCVKEAKAIEEKALADAKLGKQVGEARSDASQSKMDADYEVATQKCDAMAGEAKNSCIAAAKARFRKG